MMNLQTEFEFRLPKGYVDKDGNLHRDGVMRLANAKDEILPLQDPRVQRNDAYHIVILLSRVITRLGEMRDVNPGIVENLFATDLAYLQSFYNEINANGKARHPATCPECNARFEMELNGAGES